MSPGWTGDLAGLVEELVDGDDAFGLVADVDDDFRWRHFQDGALDDLTFRDVAEAVIVKVQKACIFLRIDLIVLRGESRGLLSDHELCHLLVDCCSASLQLAMRNGSSSIELSPDLSSGGL